MTSAIREPEELVRRIRGIHQAIRDDVVAACETRPIDDLAAAVGEEAGDTVFAIDRVSEAVLLDRFGELAREWPLVLIAEGLASEEDGADGGGGRDSAGRCVLPRGTRADDAEIVVIVDPIDGTRGLAYQKRPGWILTGVAPVRTRPGKRRGQGEAAGKTMLTMGEPTLADIELAVQTEIPLVKQHLADVLWAVAGAGARGERFNRLTGESSPLALSPSRATSIRHGYGGLARFFPGARTELAAVDDDVVRRLLGPVTKGDAAAYEDQYISTGGQLYELMAGHDRWVADLRPLIEPLLQARGEALGLTCHPYDLCTELIAREVGVVVTDAGGRRLSAPLDVQTPVSWIGYGNAAIRAAVEPALRAALAARGLGPQGGS